MSKKRRDIILSIDWDYFVDATASELCWCFPDGGNENLGSYIRTIIWGGYYSGRAKKGCRDLKDIGVRTKELKALIDFLAGVKNKEDIKLYVADSHKYCHDVVVNIEKGSKRKKFEIINIDQHHDMFEVCSNDEVNCGNWVRKLVEKGVAKCVTWVSNELSDECNVSDGVTVTRDISGVLGGIDVDRINSIYICRSDMWSPPHLDGRFIELVESLADEFEGYMPIEVSAMSDRYEMVKKQADDMGSVMSSMGCDEV